MITFRPLVRALIFSLSICAASFSAYAEESLRFDTRDPVLFYPVPSMSPATNAEEFRLYRFRANTSIVIAEFSSLKTQAQALNRIAFLIEKHEGERDIVLDEEELSALLLAKNLLPEQVYLGHNYRAGDVARFYTLAQRQNKKLNTGELALRLALMREGIILWDAQRDSYEGAEDVAVISVPGRESLAELPTMSEATYFAVLRHELSHGEFFTNPDYRDYVTSRWAGLPENIRLVFLAEFHRMGYDAHNQELMANEFQAYLWDTDVAGMIDILLIKRGSSLAQIRDEFIAGLEEAGTDAVRIYRLAAMRHVGAVAVRNSDRQKFVERLPVDS